MKNFFIAFNCLIFLASCKSQKTKDTENLPQDISMMPKKVSSKEIFFSHLQNMKTEIYTIINQVPCESATDWKISPLGSKACGGAQEYIAYPIKLEAEILPKIKDYTEQEKKYNTNFSIVSDCVSILPPSEIKCENGKAILVP